MGARGPAPKPVELKELQGNPGKRALPASLAVITNLASPEDLPDLTSGDDMLRHVLDNGGSEWIAPSDVTAHTARLLWDDWLLARETWREGGSLKDYMAITQELHRCLGKLGLTPTDRGALGLARVKAKSKLEDMREKRRSRAGRPDG